MDRENELEILRFVDFVETFNAMYRELYGSNLNYDEKKPLGGKNHPAYLLHFAFLNARVNHSGYLNLLNQAEELCLTNPTLKKIVDGVKERVSFLEETIREKTTIEEMRRLGGFTSSLEYIFKPQKAIL